jgi:hypothetical protein
MTTVHKNTLLFLVLSHMLPDQDIPDYLKSTLILSYYPRIVPSK